MVGTARWSCNEKMEREDGIYKKDLPTQSLTLKLTFQDSTLK